MNNDRRAFSAVEHRLQAINLATVQKKNNLARFSSRERERERERDRQSMQLVGRLSHALERPNDDNTTP